MNDEHRAAAEETMRQWQQDAQASEQPDEEDMHIYRLTGTVSLRNQASHDPMELTIDHKEVVKAPSKEEAIERSLSGFTEAEEPVWDQGFPIIEEIDEIEALREELAWLQQSDDGENAEYIDHRIKQIEVVLSAHDENTAIIRASGVTSEMDDAEYWNTIARDYDEARWNYEDR